MARIDPFRRSLNVDQDPSREDGRATTRRGRVGRWVPIACAVLASLGLLALPASTRPLASNTEPQTATQTDPDGTVRTTLAVAGGTIALTFRPADYKIPADVMKRWVHDQGIAVATFFGRFPVRHTTLTLRPVDSDDVTGGFAMATPAPRVVINVGRDTDIATLHRDSTITHELTHLGIPDHDEVHLWFHEGLATYVETIARAQAGQISAERAWLELWRGMKSGADGGGERGLDGTEQWDRRYWGGAIWFLKVDVELRRRTENKRGLQDAIRALQRAGGELSQTWELSRILRVADSGVGTNVLAELYRRYAYGNAPQQITEDSLSDLLRQLGVSRSGRHITFDDRAPLANIRRAITERPSAPILVRAPRSVGSGVVANAEEPNAGPASPVRGDGPKARWPLLVAPPTQVR